MRITIASIAYPFAAVSRDTAGGAEQILAALDEALVAAGHRSVVIACQGSRVAGDLISVAPCQTPITEAQRRQTWSHVRETIRDVIRVYRPHLLHYHGVDFHEYMPHTDIPSLVTLHLPLEWYPQRVFGSSPGPVWFNCVSAHQHGTISTGSRWLPPIENGIAVDKFRVQHRKRSYVLALGRVCPEKGFHRAMDAARLARVPMLLAGEIHPYEAHRQYFETEIKPRLNDRCRFLGAAGFSRKRRLLARARCLVVPSGVAETSSLVAMEALASGTPVIAFAAGALPHIVEHGCTGLMVSDERDMARAMSEVGSIKPDVCVQVARARFSEGRMARDYLSLYQHLLEVRRLSSAVHTFLHAGTVPPYTGRVEPA